MPIKKKTLVGAPKGSSSTKPNATQSELAPAHPPARNATSMRNIVAKKLAVEKLVAAKRFT